MTTANVTSSFRRSFFRSGSALFALAAFAGASTAQTPAVKTNRLVLQVSDADPAKWNLALNNASNVQTEFGGPAGVDVEVVVYGPGIGMLKAGSVAGERVASALKSGVRVVACQNTMQAQTLTQADMLPSIGYVPSGVGELVKKQQQGWAYVRP